MVEAALTLTLTLMFFWGIMEFGQAVWAYNLLAHAARTATRYGIVHGSKSKSVADNDKIALIARSQTIGLSNVNVKTTWSPNNNPGSTIKVRVSYTYSFIGPYMPAKSIQLASTSQMMILQ